MAKTFPCYRFLLDAEPTSGNMAATQGNSEGKPIGSAYKENADCRASGSNCRQIQPTFLFLYHLSRNFIRLQYSLSKVFG